MSEGLLAQLVDVLVAELVPRLCAELAGSGVSGEPWRLLSEDEAAAMLHRSASWLRTRAREGRLPFVQLDGGGRLYDPDELRAFAKARRVGPDAGAVLEGRLKLVADPAPGAASGDGDPVADRRVGGG